MSVVRGQVAPRCAGAEDPEHGVDKAAVVLCGASHFAGAAGQVWGDGFPGAVGDVVAAAGVVGCRPAYLPAGYGATGWSSRRLVGQKVQVMGEAPGGAGYGPMVR